jgi:hypothetical protein
MNTTALKVFEGEVLSFSFFFSLFVFLPLSHFLYLYLDLYLSNSL